MPYNGYNNGANMINQLYRQKDNIENMIAQYAQNFGGNQSQPPVQNIINTSNSSSDIDVKFLNQNDDISNIIISKKTLFIDENKSKISIKEVDGTISKSYDIIIPKDEKEYKRKIYEVSEGRVLNEDKARYLIEKMRPFGKKWELNETEDVRMLMDIMI